MKNELKQIGTVLRKNEIDYKEISDTIKQYKALVYKASSIDFKSENQRKNIDFGNGMALGTTWAAMCMDDMMRTKLFVKGLLEAVEMHQAENKGTTHILYAGTGPFATLILPVLANYSPDEVKCTLMEINGESFRHMQGVIEVAGFTDHITKFIQADASKVQLENPETIDIIVTETMQRALDSEQQVPIVMNLLDQLRDEVILIPEKIDVVACLTDLGKLNESESESDYCERLGSVIELSKEQLNLKTYDQIAENLIHFEEKIFKLKKETIKKFNQLTLLTEIQVFGDTWVRPYQSGLTSPKVLKELSSETLVDIDYKMQYVVNNDPKIFHSEVS